MTFEDNLDIVKFFRTLVNDLKPYATSQDVLLSFQTKVGHSSIKHYNSESLYKEITRFLKQIILYVPKNHKITVLFDVCKDNDNCCLLSITNTGVNLFRILEITASTIFNATAERIDSNASKFIVEVPLLLNEPSRTTNEKNKISLTPYYSEIGKRLSAHFTKSSNNFLPHTFKVNRKESTFLQKANNLISSKLEDNTFTVEKFASAMAMSRTQLFRKMKALTNKSPSQYILYFRLQAAKELLEAKDLDLNISDVCYSTGFMSKSHFTRSFRKQFGMLPSQMKHY